MSERLVVSVVPREVREARRAWEFVTPALPTEIPPKGYAGVYIGLSDADLVDPGKKFTLTWWSSDDGVEWRHEGGSEWTGGAAHVRAARVGLLLAPRVVMQTVSGHRTGAVDGVRLAGRMLRARVVPNRAVEASAALEVDVVKRA